MEQFRSQFQKHYATDAEDQQNDVWTTLRSHCVFFLPSVSTEMLTIAACTHVDRTERASMVSEDGGRQSVVGLHPHHKYHNVSYRLKVNVFASLTTSESVSRMRCGHPGNMPVDVVSKSFPGVVKVVQKPREHSVCLCRGAQGDKPNNVWTRSRRRRLHVRMSKKSGWLHGEVDAFDSHEQGWHPLRNKLE